MPDKKHLLDISSLSLAQMFNNSKGKTSLSYVSAAVLIVTGCVLALAGVRTKQSDAMLHGLGFASLGAGLLGIRRFTADKEVQPPAVEEMKNDNEIKA